MTTHTTAPRNSAGISDLCEHDHEIYRKLISRKLSGDQIARLERPEKVFARQRAVLAVHWHPEFVPMDVIRRRIDATFPNRATELIIPTQHNVLESYDGYTGVEVDCFSKSFNRKVQLLIHFEKDRLAGADVFKSMLAHTFNYRSRQLFEFINTIVEPALENRLQEAALQSGADEELVDFVRAHTLRLRRLYEAHESQTPPDAIRNKLLSNYFEMLRDDYDHHLVNHAKTLLGAVKRIVKSHFSNEFFYATEEIIEEVRGLGGGIVIPHPEQFWPILLEEYDVDGYEVWNPQSREFTEFLINVVHRTNKARPNSRPILIFMGDDCHMGEKVKEPRFQDAEKSRRQIGVQPPWDDFAIRKSLIVANVDRRRVIEEYKGRLAS